MLEKQFPFLYEGFDRDTQLALKRRPKEGCPKCGAPGKLQLRISLTPQMTMVYIAMACTNCSYEERNKYNDLVGSAEAPITRESFSLCRKEVFDWWETRAPNRVEQRNVKRQVLATLRLMSGEFIPRELRTHAQQALRVLLGRKWYNMFVKGELDCEKYQDEVRGVWYGNKATGGLQGKKALQ